MPTRPPSVHSTASSTDSEDCDENYVAMVSSMSTDEPVCNTQLSSDLRSCMIFFSILKSQIITARKNLNVYFDFYCDMCLLKLFLHHLHTNNNSFHNRCTINTVEFLWGRQSFTMQPRISGCNCCTEGIRNTLFQFSLLSLRHTLVWTNYWLLQTDSSPLQLFLCSFLSFCRSAFFILYFCSFAFQVVCS